MTETILQTLAHFAAKTREQGIDAALQQDVKRRVMDTLGICLAASMLEPATIVEQVIEDWGGSPRASIVGRQQQYPASSAALFNGTLAHALDFDDTHLPSVLHPSA